SPYVGYLNPRTGVLTEYKLPALADGRINKGTHACRVDNTRGYVWATQGGGQGDGKFGPLVLFRLKMATGDVKQFMTMPIDLGGSNFDLAPDGSLWGGRTTEDGRVEIRRVDPESGAVTASYPRTTPWSYQHAVSADGRFVSGGSPGSVRP